MSRQLEHATPTKISGIHEGLIERKLRIAGRVLSYDAIHGVAVLLDFDGKHTISVDIGSALDDRSKEWVNERLSTVVVIGYLEKPPSEIPESSQLPVGVVPPSRAIQLRALLVVPAADLDIKLWNRVVDDVQGQEEQSSLHVADVAPVTPG